MFKFLKEKLKKTISNIGKKVKEEVPDMETEKELVEEAIEEKKPKEKSKKKKEKKVKEAKKEISEERSIKEPKEELPVKQEEPKEEIQAEPEEKKGFFQKIVQRATTKKISEDNFDELFDDLEITLLENNVAVEVIEKLKEDLKKEIVDKPLQKKKIEETIKNTLEKSIEALLIEKENLIPEIKSKKPFTILFLGINGSGKTTTIAKFANLLKKEKLSSILVAADTFRAASIEQLKEWGDKLDTKVIAHDYGSDPSSVAFDAVKHAQTKNADVVLIDTAGRLHSNKDLMNELKKIVRVVEPDLKIFVGESITGNDAVSQAQEFNESVGIDGIILTKADVDEKGGAIISVSHVTNKPIFYLGTGQELSDLKEFNKQEILEKLGI